MERTMLREIKNPQEEPIRLPVYVADINTLQCTKNGKHYFFVYVTDGELTDVFRLYDSRMENARERFEKKVAYITVKGKGNLYISKIEECSEIPESEFGDTEALKCPRVDADQAWGPGEKYKDAFCCLPVLVTDVGPLKTSKNNKPYYMITASDGETSSSFYIWDDKADEIRRNTSTKQYILPSRVDEYPKVAHRSRSAMTFRKRSS